MHGGVLSTQNIVVIPESDLLIAAFSHQLYFFSLAETTIANRSIQHQAQIIALHYQASSRMLTSVDQNGLVFRAEVDPSGRFVNPKKARIDIGEVLVSGEVSVGINGELEVYAVSQNGKLIRFVEGVTGIIAQNIQKLLYISQEMLIVLSDKRHIQVYNASSLHLRYEYKHQFQVTSVEIYRSNLIVGDARGKINILNNFLEAGEVQLRQKLEWHVHEVSALKIEQSYLYSGGEEGVIVLWHLRENKRDFLPRLGAQIINIKVVQSKVYCILADNTIKSIDLNNDKALLHYKTIVNPNLKWIAPTSAVKVTTNLVRVSPMQNQIYLRSQPGKIQSIHLGNAVNSQFSIVGRNATSRLDNNLPNPHQITDIAFSKDGSQLVAAVEGTNSRCLKFYFQDQGTFQLLSRVENCHRGEEQIHLLAFGEKFVSYSASDSVIKVWRRMSRRKQSILEVEQHYQACEYEIGYRQKTPRFVSTLGDYLTVLYANQFVLFNTSAKKIEGVYSFESGKVVAVYQLQGKNNTFLVVYQNYVEKIDFGGKKQHSQRIIDLSKDNSTFDANQIVFNQRQQSFAFLVNQQHQQNVYIYRSSGSVELLEVETSHSRITDLFWIGSSLVALDSGLSLQNLTSDKQLVHWQQKEEVRVVEEQMEQEQTQINDYEHLYSKHLQRQYRRDRSSIDRTSEMLQVTPSITSSLQLFTSQLFL